MASKFQETNRFVLDEFLDTFGREFCKHEVLWKPQPNGKGFGIQSATHVAHRTLAQALNLSLEAVLELLETFPAACLDLISRYEMRRKIDAGCCMPDWLKLLAGHFRLVNKSTKYNRSAVLARHELLRALCESARVGLGAGGSAAGTEGEASPLRGPQAVAYFVARHGISEEEVLPAWRSALELSVVKLRAVLAAGDRVWMLPPALRPAAAERALADLALLHDCSLSQITVLTPAKLQMLVLLFQLIVAAKSTYDEVRGRVGRADAGDDVLSRAVGAGREERSHGCSAEGAPAPEESLDDEPHTELDSEPVTLVISSDTSDGEISDKYLEEYSDNNREVPVLLHKGRVEESGTDMMEKTDVSCRERGSYNTSSKSDSRSEYPTKYWYEESESNSSEKRKVVWALVYTELVKRGRAASLISLQHRWVELLHLARTALLTAWNTPAGRNVHPLLLAVAHRFPKIFTEQLPSWKRLVLDRQIVLESDVNSIILKYQENGNVLLNITENLTFPDLLKKYVNDKNVTDPHGPVSRQIRKENPTGVINNMDDEVEQDSRRRDHGLRNELNVNNDIITTLDRIDPTRATVSIVILEDSEDDKGDGDDAGSSSRETTPGLNDCNVSNSEGGATYLGEENNHAPCTLEHCDDVTEIDLKNIEKEQTDDLNGINGTTNPGSALFVTDDRGQLNENIKDNNKLVKDKQTGSRGFGPRERSGLLEPHSSVIDEKLVNVSRVVVTPIEHLPEWKKHSRNGVIKCRNFSVRNFTKPVTATSKQLSKCTPHIGTDDGNARNWQADGGADNEGRIQFEDDSFETDFDLGDDINNGIKHQKYIELYAMPDHSRRSRIRLTRTLKLSRTYFSLNFWSLDSNIELLKACRPLCVRVNKAAPRALLAAQAQRSCASQEAVNSTNNSTSSGSGTTSAVDSVELLKHLTKYAIQTNIPQKSVIESVTKDITSNSNLMDSILETMRLTEKNNNQNSTLQRTPFPSSEPSDSCDTNISKNMCAANTFHTKPTEEVRDDLQSNSVNNSHLGATTSQSYVSSNHSKDVYKTHLQKMDNVNKASLQPKQTRVPNVADLKGMILLLVKHFDSNMTHESGMKLNRSSLNLHFKNFEKQQRVLVKNISDLAKLLPQYVLNMKPTRTVTKNAAVAHKQKKINKIKCKQSKELCTLPGSDSENISDVATDTNTVIADDDCELNLVIDERSSELSDNVDLNNSKCNKINTNKNIQETCNIRKNDKKEKNIKKAKRKFKKPKTISENEKPVLNEYQEWHRQKTMALKYFTLPTSDTSKLTSKDKTAKQKSTTTSTEQQNNGCQTNMTIKKTNREDLATTPIEHQSNGCQTNMTIKRTNREDLATTPIEHQSNGCQTNMTIKRTNREDLATTPIEHRSNGCQTNMTIKRTNREDLATTPIEHRSNGCQTNMTIKRTNREDLATTPIEHRSNSCQTNMTIKRTNREESATTPIEHRSNGCQTNMTIKRKNTEDLATTPIEHRSNGCQTNMTIKRKNTEDLATTSSVSDRIKRSKLPSNESNVVYISDTSSDDDVQTTECYIPKDTNESNPNTTQPDIHPIGKIENGNKIVIFNDSSQKQAANPNVCVINPPVADSSRPVYLIINDTRMPTATPDALNKTEDSKTINSPIVFQVLSDGTSFPTLTQVVQQNKIQQTQMVVMNEKCKLTNKCNCIKCENTLKDDILTCTLDEIQNLPSLDSINKEPSTSLPTPNEHLIKEAITVKEYLAGNKKLTALIKVDRSKKLVCFCSKYIILTDVNIPSVNATYRTTIKINNKKKLSRVLVPDDSMGSVLLLGPKNESDYIHCDCLKGTRPKCNLCQHINMTPPNPTKVIKVGGYYYRNICENPIKYVRLNDNELATNSRSVLEGNPDLILVNKMFFKKLTDSPATYVRILSALPDAATLRHLVRKEVVLYAFNVTQTDHSYTPLQYAQTDGRVSVHHTDDKLVKGLQWILN